MHAAWVPMLPWPRVERHDAAMDRDYDGIHGEFDSPLMRQIRQEAYGEDIGQHSWVTADELRSDL
jgi:hypothetical protein